MSARLSLCFNLGHSHSLSEDTKGGFRVFVPRFVSVRERQRGALLSSLGRCNLITEDKGEKGLMTMQFDSRKQPFVEYDGRRFTFVPKGRNGNPSKDWSDSPVIRIQAHRYDTNGKELNQLCPGAELHINSFKDIGIIMGLLAEVAAAGFRLQDDDRKCQ